MYRQILKTYSRKVCVSWVEISACAFGYWIDYLHPIKSLNVLGKELLRWKRGAEWSFCCVSATNRDLNKTKQKNNNQTKNKQTKTHTHKKKKPSKPNLLSWAIFCPVSVSFLPWRYYFCPFAVASCPLLCRVSYSGPNFRLYLGMELWSEPGCPCQYVGVIPTFYRSRYPGSQLAWQV